MYPADIILFGCYSVQEVRHTWLVRWETLEDHATGFRQSAEYQEWKRLLHPFYDPFPTVEHYAMVLRHPA